jgi:hypothetical protein
VTRYLKSDLGCREAAFKAVAKLDINRIDRIFRGFLGRKYRLSYVDKNKGKWK